MTQTVLENIFLAVCRIYTAIPCRRVGRYKHFGNVLSPSSRLKCNHENQKFLEDYLLSSRKGYSYHQVISLDSLLVFSVMIVILGKPCGCYAPFQVYPCQDVIDGSYTVMTEFTYAESCLEILNKITKASIWAVSLEDMEFFLKQSMNMSANDVWLLSCHRWYLWLIKFLTHQYVSLDVLGMDYKVCLSLI